MTDASRREFLAAGSGLVAVAGFDRLGRRWVTESSSAPRRSSLNRPPELDGVLLTDAAGRREDAHDLGNIVRRVPVAVLRPGSVRDIIVMVRFCRSLRIKVAMRGQAHSTFGQGLTPGLLIESRWLDKIHSIGPDGAVVDAGVVWHDLIQAAFAVQLSPPAITGYTRLSVGGTLSMGGISAAYAAGSQAARVSELEVVTGAGELVRCSRTLRPELFDAVRAGIGQCALITRATVDLVAVASMARSYVLEYTDNAAFFADLRTLLSRGELNAVYALWPVVGPGAVYVLNATAYFDPATPPDDDRLLRGLTVPSSAATHQDGPYLDAVFAVDRVYDAYQADGWDALIKPWLDVWLPEDAVEDYVHTAITSLAPADVGATGFVLLIPHRRTVREPPLLRLPRARRDGMIYLFDILTSSATPGPDPVFVDAMLARNRRLYDAARRVGGTRYPIGSIPFAKADWREHYGPVWPAFARAKRRYDPDAILTPGPGIF